MKNMLDQADYQTLFESLTAQAETLALSCATSGIKIPDAPKPAMVRVTLRGAMDGSEAEGFESVDLVHSCELMEAHIAQLKALSNFAPKICEPAGAGGKSGVAVAPLFNQPARLQSPSKPMTATEKLLAARGVSSVDQLRNAPKK